MKGTSKSRVNYVVNYSYVLGSFSSLFRVRISTCTYFRATAMRVRSKVKAVGV